MTPAARYAAAIDVLDRCFEGDAAVKALIAWARSSRFAGSKDRATVRDHVFDALRARASLAGLGGGLTGRGVVLGLLRREGIDPETVFTGEGYAPVALSELEQAAFTVDPKLSDADAHDIPEWLWSQWQADLGRDAKAAAKALQSRAAVMIRCNLTKATRADLQTALSGDDIATTAHPTCETALIVTTNPRRLALSSAFADGWFEMQDASSQMAVARLPLKARQTVLDYCAGGGGKSLALAAMHDVSVTAHDISVRRMSDIPVRAKRAGVDIQVVGPAELDRSQLFDLVFVDAPCSGSGTWRRAPDAKWQMTPDKLSELNALQAEVIAKAAAHVAPNGHLIYATCSVLSAENDAIVTAFTSATKWHVADRMSLPVTDDHDGFFLLQLKR